MTPHKLWLEPEELIFLADDERAPACRTVSNRGTNASTWEALTTAEWLSVDGPLPTSLSPGLGLTPSWIDVCVVPDGLADYGSYSTVITATSTLTSTVNEPRTVPVFLSYQRSHFHVFLPDVLKFHPVQCQMGRSVSL